MGIITWAGTYWLDILIIFVILAVALIAWRMGQKEYVKEFLYSLVCEAEKTYGSIVGDVKRATVVGWVYERLPFIVRLCITRKQLDDGILAGVARLKLALQKPGANLLSYNEEKLLAAELPDLIIE